MINNLIKNKYRIEWTSAEKLVNCCEILWSKIK